MCQLSIVLPENHLEMIREMLRLKIFVDINGHKIDSKPGVISFGCSDCDQFDDMYSHRKEILDNSRIHALNFNGGALLLTPNSPAFKSPEFFPFRESISKFFREGIYIAQNKKTINTAVLEIHSPCAISIDNAIDPIEATDTLMKAKALIKAESLGRGKELKVACFHHMDYARCGTGKDKKRTHFIPRENWEKKYNEIMRIRESLL